MNDQQSLGGINVNITANYGEFKQGVDVVERKLDTLTNKFSSASSKISSSAVAVGNVIADAVSKVASVITSNISYAVKRLDSLNRFPIVMQNLGIGATDASNAIQALANYTLGLPTTLNDAAEKVQYFTSATGNVWQSIKIFQALNDAIVSGAQTAEVQSTALYQWSQAIVRGSFDIEREFNAMVVANAKAVNEIAEQLLGAGKDFNDLWDALKDGETTVYDMVDAMVYLDENGSDALESWSSRAQKSVAGIDTAITRFKTNIGKAVAVVAEEIGWKNIYTFINNVGDAIYKAGQYVAAFVRILKEAFAWISVIFGGKAGSTSEIVKETSAAADNASSIASGASDAADSLDDATSSAKKLHKQLASFDEMNVLQESSSSGSGSGSSGGGGSGSYNFDWESGVLGQTTDKIAAIVDTIKAKFAELFGDIDFGPLQASLQRFVKALKTGLNGALKVGKRFLSDFIAPLTKFAVENALPRVFDAVSQAIEEINFDALADAFGKLFSAAESVGEVMLDIFADLVEMLAPLASWIANNLVPAFLNALAGALQFLGAIISGMWEAAFKPLIQGFLIPIAQFTGGIAVSVLNAIGDALSWIASNKVAVDVIVALTTGVLAGIAAYEAYQVIMGVVMGIQLAMNGATIAGTAANGAYALGLGVVSAAQSLYSTITAVATGATTAFAAAMQLLPFVAIATAVAAVVFGITQLVSSENEAERATDELGQAVSEATEQWDDNEDGIISTTEALEHYNDVVMAVNNAELGVINAQEDLLKATENLDEYVKKYNKTEDELIQLHKENKLSTLGLSDDALRSLQKAIINVENSQIKLTKAQEKKIETDVTEQQMISAAWGDYNKYGKELVEVAKSQGLASDAYKEAEKKLQAAREKAEKYGEANMSIIDYTKMAKKAVEDMGNQVNSTANTLQNSSFNVGGNLSQGLINGLNSKSGAVWNAGYGIGQSAVSGMKRGADTHSPSKLSRQIGAFLGEGLILGMQDEETPVERAAESLAETVLEAFSPLNDLSVNLPELGNNLVSVSREASDFVDDIPESDSLTQVIVKIGEETLVDRIVAGINDRSFMTNRAIVSA